MTAIAVRLGRKPTQLISFTVIGAIALVVAAFWLTLLSVRSNADAATVTVTMTPAKAEAIINATSGSAKDQVQAVGDAEFISLDKQGSDRDPAIQPRVHRNPAPLRCDWE